MDSKMVPPDGGYGWVVLLGSSIIIFTTTPFISVFAILYRETFAQLGSSSAAWTFCIYLTLWNFMSLFVGPLVALRSYRWTISVGLLLMGSGAIFSGFANTKVDLYLSIGLVIGTGQGLVTNASILVLITYFKRKLGLIMGILYTVMAVGGIVAPIIVAALLKTLDNDRVCIVGYGVFVLLGLLGAALLRPVGKYLIVDTEAETGDEEPNDESTAAEREALQETDISPQTKKKKKNILTLISWQLLRDRSFLIMIAGSAYGFTCVLNFYLFVPLYCQMLLLDRVATAQLLSIVSSVDLFSRFFFAWMGDWACVRGKVRKPRKVIFASCGVAVGVTMLFLPLCKSFGHLAAVCALFGLFAGSLYSNGPLIYSESYPDQMASAFGLSCCLRAIVALLFGGLIEILKKTEGGYDSCLWVGGGVTVALMSLWFLDELWWKCSAKSESSNNSNNNNT